MITLIKSVCYHHRNIRFYLIHQDYPNEWFNTLNKYLINLESEIIPVTILHPFNFDVKLEKHITQATFYRYFVSEIPEERILYLDSDIVVDGNIEEMYFSDFNGKYVLAVEDMYVNHTSYYNTNIRPYFNAGVLLINNALWATENLKQELIQMTLQHPQTALGDQDILNLVLKNKWGMLDNIYNYQAGIIHNYPRIHKDMSDEEIKTKYQNQVKDEKYKIIHYTSECKPWLNNEFFVLLRKKYWFYYQLSWEEIKKHHQELFAQ